MSKDRVSTVLVKLTTIFDHRLELVAENCSRLLLYKAGKVEFYSFWTVL